LGERVGVPPLKPVRLADPGDPVPDEEEGLETQRYSPRSGPT
jgi:hypothetical protein